MNPMLVGAWLVLSATSAIPYSSMHQCNMAKEQLADNGGPTGHCILGNNPMYGDVHETVNKLKKSHAE